MTAGAPRERRGGGEDDGRAWTVDAETRERVDRVRSMGLDRLMATAGPVAPGAPRAARDREFAVPSSESEDETDAPTSAVDSDADEEPPRGVRDEAPARPPREASDSDATRSASSDDPNDSRDSNDSRAPGAPGAHRPPANESADADAECDAGDSKDAPEDAFAEDAEDAFAEDADASADASSSDSPASRRATRCRVALIRLRDEMFAADPTFKRRSVVELNAEAVAHLRAGDDMRAVAAFAKVFRKLRDNHLTHASLHVCHSNRSAAYLNLGLHEEALWDARRCLELAEAKWARTRDLMAVAPVFVKGHARKGFALMGMGMPRAAKQAFEAGLAMDPAHAECKRGLEEAVIRIARDLASGRGRETLALPPATRVAGKISNLPHAAPLHSLHVKDQLPVRLLTPFQAENEYHIRDTYNYVTVQADIRMPGRHFGYLCDRARLEAFERAITIAIDRTRAEAKDARVLNLGCGAGVLAACALRAGAHHVVAADRWLYHAMAAKENLLNNGFGDDQVKVVYKRPTDLAMLRDVPVSCNVCVNDVLEDGLLAAGLVPSFRHAHDRLLMPDAIVVPSSAQVMVMPVEMRTRTCRGLDVSAMNAYRWTPTHTSGGVPIADDAWTALARPAAAFRFDFQTPPEEGETREADLRFERDGRFNAVLFWYDLNLIEGVELSTAPRGYGPGEDPDDPESAFFSDASSDANKKAARPTSLRVAMQYLPGEIEVKAGDALPLVCAHNTVQMQFSVPEAEYLHLRKLDASFPQYHFAMLADERRARAYDEAIQRRVGEVTKRDGEARVLDVGAGSGLLSMMAARAGARSALACEWHGSLAACARRNVAANRMSDVVTVARGDAAKLRRGVQGVPIEGCNLVVIDLFDAGLTGEHALWMLEKARRNVLTPDAVVVPAAATMYCMGVEAYTSEVLGFDVSAQNKYRWDKTYETVRMSDVPHRALTRPKKVFEFAFDGSKTKGRGRESVLRLETVASGYLNAVVFWFDLHMDERETITTAPAGVGKGGRLREEERFEGDKEGLEAERRRRDEAARDALERAVARHRETLERNPRTDLGAAKAEAERRATEEKEEERKKKTNPDDDPGALGDAADAGEIVASAIEPEDEPEGFASETSRSRTRDEHYWGQALQYLERGAQVRARKKVTLLAKRENDRVTFNLKEGVGAYVGKPPWRIEWGGGASVESPHFQRVHYCELLVGDYLMRLQSKRFPPIEKEMRMILAHCGNLFGDPATIADVTHRFACLELVHGQDDFSEGATMEALTKPPLTLC